MTEKAPTTTVVTKMDTMCSRIGGEMRADKVNANRFACMVGEDVRFSGTKEFLGTLVPKEDAKKRVVLEFNEVEAECKKAAPSAALSIDAEYQRYECPPHFDVVNNLVANSPYVMAKTQHLLIGGGVGIAIILMFCCCLAMVMLMRR